MSRTNIYIDIDGVLLANEFSLAEGAVEFIKHIGDNFTVYWLTTHCMHGNPGWAIEYVDRASEEDLTPWLNKFIPTEWSMMKTEAIDFDQPFFWFDDDCYTAEKKELAKNKTLRSWMEVDLSKHPDQLIHELKFLKSLD